MSWFVGSRRLDDDDSRALCSPSDSRDISRICRLKRERKGANVDCYSDRLSSIQRLPNWLHYGCDLLARQPGISCSLPRFKARGTSGGQVKSHYSYRHL